MAITIYDVAQKAGVSISTVSRVLNNNPNVQEDTRQKVLQSIAELKFKPNPIARGLVVKQTNLIEVFFSWSGYQFNLQSAWYVGLLNGINEVVQENQYGLLINTIAGVFDPQEVYRKVYHNALDGVLMVSPYLEEKDVLQMMDQRIPVVLIGYRTDDPRMDYVDSDNVDAAVQVVDHLVKLGHRKIAFISGQTGTSRNALDRLKGFQQAMKKNGLAIAEGYVVDGNFLRGVRRRGDEKTPGPAGTPDGRFRLQRPDGFGSLGRGGRGGADGGRGHRHRRILTILPKPSRPLLLDHGPAGLPDDQRGSHPDSPG